MPANTSCGFCARSLYHTGMSKSDSFTDEEYARALTLIQSMRANKRWDKSTAADRKAQGAAMLAGKRKKARKAKREVAK